MFVALSKYMNVGGTVIIGGGLAGLTIAEFLANRKSDNVILLEQYKAWGGRVATYRDKSQNLQYEIGAGRIFHTHKRVAALVRRFGLHTYPISTSSDVINGDTQHPNPFLAVFEPVRKILATIPQAILAKHTVADLVPKELHAILDYYPYWCEFNLLRADIALPLFTPSHAMGATGAHAYYGIVEGIDAITTGLHDAAEKAGATLKNRHTVTNITRTAPDLFEITGLKGKKGEQTPFKYEANRVIIATCRCGYSDFSILKDMPLMKQLATGALTRIYAVYDPPLPITEKIVTDNPLRHIIPIRDGLIMISYTDGDDTKFWKDLDDIALEDAIHKELQKLFPDMTIPKPKYLKKHMWPNGCTYWLPGTYDPKTASIIAHNPEPNLYLTGESVSLNQTWMEGALESAEYLETLLK
jgi:monoamine oxidase